MSTLAVANSLHPVSRRAWERLCIAFVFSLCLRLALMLGIPVNPTGGVPCVTSVISARLEPAPIEVPVGPTIEQPLPAADLNLVPDKPAVTDPLTEKAQSKPEP